MMFPGVRKLRNICCGHKMFLNKIRNIFCVSDTKFVSTTNVARAVKRGNICVGNNVSSFARAFTPSDIIFTSGQGLSITLTLAVFLITRHVSLLLFRMQGPEWLDILQTLQGIVYH